MTHKFHRLTILTSIVGLLLAACGAAPSESWSGVALSGDGATLYIAANTHLYALSLDGNKATLLWQQPSSRGGGIFGIFGGGDSSADSTSVNLAPVYANPALVGDLLIVSSHNQSVYGLNIKDGTEKWVFPIVADKGKSDKDQPRDRLFAGPVVHGDRVYVASADNSLYALNLADGTLKWTYKTGNSLWAAPLVTDDTVYIPSMDHTLYAVDLDGREKWKKELDGALAGSPALSQDGRLLYVGSLNDTLYAIDALGGSEVWTVKTHGWVWATPVVAEGAVYVADMKGTVYALDPVEGAVKWEKNVGGVIRGTPAVSGDTLIVALDQQGIVYALNTADGSQKWAQEIDNQNADRLDSDLLVAGDKVLVVPISAADLVYALNFADGTQAWTFKPS